MSPSILVIEDDNAIGNTLRVLLESEGYVVEIARNGQEALDFLMACSVLPSLILLDLVMPLMDGFEFRQHQERDARIATIPVVVMTAASGPIDCLRIGAAGFVRKPTGLEEVLEAVSLHRALDSPHNLSKRLESRAIGAGGSSR